MQVATENLKEINTCLGPYEMLNSVRSLNNCDKIATGGVNMEEYTEIAIIVPNDFMDLVLEHLDLCGVIIKSPYRGISDVEYTKFLMFLIKSQKAADN